MLDVKDLSVFHGRRAVCDGISFSLEQGSVTALLGLNGSGKSTLLSAIGGSIPAQGEIRLMGEDLSSLPPRERAKKLALLPQMMSTPPFTVEETVACGRNPYRSTTARLSPEDERAVEEAIRKTGIDSLRDRHLASLSGGERQICLLAMVLAQETPLLLLDEPTSFLDKAKEHLFWETLARVIDERGTTVLAAMHDLTAAVRVSDRFMLLQEGRLLFHGTRAELLSSNLLECTFGVKRYETEDGPVFA